MLRRRHVAAQIQADDGAFVQLIQRIGHQVEIGRAAVRLEHLRAVAVGEPPQARPVLLRRQAARHDAADAAILARAAVVPFRDGHRLVQIADERAVRAADGARLDDRLVFADRRQPPRRLQKAWMVDVEMVVDVVERAPRALRPDFAAGVVHVREQRLRMQLLPQEARHLLIHFLMQVIAAVVERAADLRRSISWQFFYREVLDFQLLSHLLPRVVLRQPSVERGQPLFAQLRHEIAAATTRNDAFVDHRQQIQRGILRQRQPRVGVLMPQEVACERLPAFHRFCIDGQEILEFIHGDVAFLARIDFRRANITGNINICREIDAALFQRREQVVELIHFLRIYDRRIVRIVLDEAVFMMMVAQRVVAETRQTIRQDVALLMGENVRRHAEIHAVETLRLAGQFLEFEILPDGFRPAVFAGGTVQRHNIREINGGAFFNLQFVDQRNPRLAVRLHDNWPVLYDFDGFRQRHRERHDVLLAAFPAVHIFLRHHGVLRRDAHADFKLLMRPATVVLY